MREKENQQTAGIRTQSYTIAYKDSQSSGMSMHLTYLRRGMVTHSRFWNPFTSIMAHHV